MKGIRMKPPNASTRPKKARPHAGDILQALSRLIQIAKLYDDNNKLVASAVSAFKQRIHQSGNGSEHVSLQIHNGRFYLQEEKVPLYRKDAQLFNRILKYLETRQICGFHFASDLGMIAIPEFTTFVRLLHQSTQHASPVDWFTRELDLQDIHWLVAIKASDHTRQQEPLLSQNGPTHTNQRNKEAAKKTYHFALGSVKEVADKLLTNKEASIRKSLRMVQRMVDIITEDDTTFFALSTIRMYDDYTYTHSLNVALLAMALGKRIGMQRKTLEKLGLCGLFHDLGKIEVPKQILNKRGKLNDAEFEEIKKHSMNSALLILKLKTEKYRKVHLLVSPFEHHIRFDHSGYPNLDRKRPISLFGRILTIVDVYDAITSPRIYRPTSMSPDKALGIMLADSGTHFDPVLLKIFVNMLGVYPIGTVLRLDNGEMGLAVKSSNEADPARPMVQLLRPGSGHKYAKGDLIDLTDRDPQSGAYKWNIVKTQHPAALGIQPAQYML